VHETVSLALGFPIGYAVLEGNSDNPADEQVDLKSIYSPPTEKN
jgi:hypothetical protein